MTTVKKFREFVSDYQKVYRQKPAFVQASPSVYADLWSELFNFPPRYPGELRLAVQMSDRFLLYGIPVVCAAGSFNFVGSHEEFDEACK